MSEQWYVKLYERFPDYDDEPYTQGTVSDVDFIEGIIDHNRSTTILDVGCGTGRHVLELARRGYEQVTGIDPSEALIAQAKRKANIEKLAAEFKVMDARHLDYQAVFDVVLSMFEGALSLMETDELERQIMSNVAAALKPEGIFIAIVPNAVFMLAQTLEDTPFDPVTHRETFSLETTTADENTETLQCEQRYYTCPELRCLLTQAGFAENGFFAVKPEGPAQSKQPSTSDFEIGPIAQKK